MKAILLHNLRAGQRNRGNEVVLAATRLVEAGWEVDVASPDPSDTDRVLRGAIEDGAEAVIVAGGDGSINLALQTIARTPVALGVIPTGTGNVWAREVGIPLDVRGATNTLLRGDVRIVDLGRANGRYFLAMAGVGFDATVTRVMKATSKRRLGMLAYVVAATVEALRLRGSETVISVGGLRLRRRILMVAVCNTRLYGAVLRMAPDAFLDDGLLDVSVFYGKGLWAKVRHPVKALFGTHGSDPDVESFGTAGLRIESKDYLPVQLDGDYFGTTPVEIDVVPAALRVIIPPGPHPQFRGRVLSAAS
ncbi:MAG TPA: YegS/Rv2252/BmrU family lipid kinase [Chloroflexota bacterium]